MAARGHSGFLRKHTRKPMRAAATSTEVGAVYMTPEFSAVISEFCTRLNMERHSVLRLQRKVWALFINGIPGNIC